jgi:protein-S-isoprenylcysteine O-methyltransferase Ste14
MPGGRVEPVSIPVAVGALWVAFWLYWLAAAVTAKRSVARSPQGFLIRLVIVGVVFAILRVSGLRAEATFGRSPFLEAVGLALLVAGLGVAVWARVNLGRNWGTPMSEKVDAELVTTGPYRLVRHPIYSGLIIALIGTALTVAPILLLGVALLCGYFVWSATAEERTMLRLFPDRYGSYQQRTRMLVPFLF